MSDLSNYIAPISTLVFIVFGVFGYGWFRILKETNVLLKEQNEELKAANKDLTEKRLEDIGKLASMQGQIDVLKSIPLVNIDSTFKQIAEFNKSLATSNKQILEELKKSAELLKKHQEKEAEAIKQVKSDLENK